MFSGLKPMKRGKENKVFSYEENEACSGTRKRSTWFRNTKKLYLFTARTNKTKAEQKKHEMQRKNNTQPRTNKAEIKNSIFCIVRTQKSKLFGEKIVVLEETMNMQ